MTRLDSSDLFDNATCCNQAVLPGSKLGIAMEYNYPKQMTR
ncbi:TPA: hypothetical protein ACGO21_002155 [Streptococcus suis]|nr:hypothetical protein [Streptococcus suis]